MPPELSTPPSWSPAFPPMAAFGGAPIYSAGGEAILVSVMNAAAGVTVTITGRTLALDQAKPSPFSATIVPATDRSVSTRLIPIPDGWLLSAQAIVSAGTPLTGQTFVKLSLVHGVAGTPPELWTLVADYVTSKQALSYPGAGIVDPTETAGALRSITGSVPGAGAEISETVPTGARWELLALRASLTTSVAVANRIPDFVLDDGANIYWRAPQGTAQTASLALGYQVAQGLVGNFSDSLTTFFQCIPMSIRLGSGHRLRTITSAIQGADQWTAPQYLVREWIEGN